MASPKSSLASCSNYIDDDEYSYDVYYDELDDILKGLSEARTSRWFKSPDSEWHKNGVDLLINNDIEHLEEVLANITLDGYLGVCNFDSIKSRKKRKYLAELAIYLVYREDFGAVKNICDRVIFTDSDLCSMTNDECRGDEVGLFPLLLNQHTPLNVLEQVLHRLPTNVTLKGNSGLWHFRQSCFDLVPESGYGELYRRVLERRPAALLESIRLTRSNYPNLLCYIFESRVVNDMIICNIWRNTLCFIARQWRALAEAASSRVDGCCMIDPRIFRDHVMCYVDNPVYDTVKQSVKDGRFSYLQDFLNKIIHRKKMMRRAKKKKNVWKILILLLDFVPASILYHVVGDDNDDGDYFTYFELLHQVQTTYFGRSDKYNIYSRELHLNHL